MKEAPIPVARAACPKCGYDLRGIEPDGYEVVCPECGGRWYPGQLGEVGSLLDRRIRSVHLWWGWVGGIVSAVCFTASFVWVLFAFILRAWSGASHTMVIWSLAPVGIVMVVWVALIFRVHRSFRRVYSEHDLDALRARAMQSTGKVVLVHITMVLAVWIAILLWLAFNQ